MSSRILTQGLELLRGQKSKGGYTTIEGYSGMQGTKADNLAYDTMAEFTPLVPGLLVAIGSDLSFGRYCRGGRLAYGVIPPAGTAAHPIYGISTARLSA
jgi:hypothetical protein